MRSTLPKLESLPRASTTKERAEAPGANASSTSSAAPATAAANRTEPPAEQRTVGSYT
jgi:hypothetical protein